MNKKIKKLAVFVSGTGTNFLAIQKEIIKKNIKGQIKVLISSNPKAQALITAKKYQIDNYVFQLKNYNSPFEFERELLNVLSNHDCDFIILAGYLKKIPNSIIKKYPNKIVNIHPALLPKFGGKGMYGIHVHEAVLQSGEKETGVTIHLIDEKYDNGPIIIQEKVKVNKNDTPQELQQRVLKIEHKLYPKVIKLLCDDKIKIINNKVIIN